MCQARSCSRSLRDDNRAFASPPRFGEGLRVVVGTWTVFCKGRGARRDTSICSIGTNHSVAQTIGRHPRDCRGRCFSAIGCQNDRANRSVQQTPFQYALTTQGGCGAHCPRHPDVDGCRRGGDCALSGWGRRFRSDIEGRHVGRAPKH